MVLLNVLVVAKEDSRVLLGWEIMRSLSPEATFATLFREKLLSRINLRPPDQVNLDSCFIGKEKHCLDKTDATFPVSDVVGMFGPYVKFFVSFADDPPPNPPVRNAFDIIRRSVWYRHHRKRPTLGTEIKGRRKKIYTETCKECKHHAHV